MRKLKLQMDHLRVESFSVDQVPSGAGTVHGATGPNTCATCVQYTGCRADNNTCYDTCNSCGGAVSCVCETGNCPYLPDM